MNTWTIPRRISLAFLLLVFLTLVIGAVALWRIGGVNRQVVNLATNTVPSVVELGRITQSNARSGRAARRVLQLEGDAQGQAAAAASFRDSRIAGDASCSLYGSSLTSDKEDIRLFNLATEARTLFYKKADTLLELTNAGKIDDAQQWLLKEVDPALEDCVDKFKASIDYNSELAKTAASTADTIVGRSYWVIGAAVALSALAGLVVGWSIIQAVRRSLGMISDALEDGAAQTASASGQVSAASHLLAEGCNEQGSSVAETSAALEEMSVMIRSTADNAVKAKAFANQARVAAQSGAETMVEMNTAMHAIEASSAEVAKIVKNIDEIVQKVAAADALVAEISTAAREQSQGIQQVGTAMAQLDKVTQGNATNAQQSASAAEELNSQARTLQEMVAYLRSLVTGPSGAGIAPPSRTPVKRVDRLPTKLARQAIRSGAPLRGLTAGSRGGRMQIPMPGDAGAPVDQEDRNFTTF